MQKIKTFLENRLFGIILALMIIQPAMDVASYFADRGGLTSITTLMRFGLLALAALFGFLLTDNKRAYLILYAAIALFWGAHMLNCFRIGYISPVKDTGNLLRLLNFPLYALTFITALRGRPELRKAFYLGAFIAFLEIVLFTALPWLTGSPIHTYEQIEVGVLGWFLIPSAQSAIIVLSAPLAVYAAYKSGKYPVYLLGVFLPIALMFVTGTKLDFYSIFIIGGAYIFLFLLRLGKEPRGYVLKYALPVFVMLLLTALFRGKSPMMVRNSMTAYSQNIYSTMIEESLENSGADQETLDLIHQGGAAGKISSERQLENLRRTVLPIYSDTGVYGFRTAELNARFGMYNVMEFFDYTDSPAVLSNTRQVKLNYAKMVWHEKDLLTHFLGFEYSDFLLGDSIYDLENDFPGVFYNVGYIGIALYALIFILFFFEAFRALGGDIRRAYSLEREKGPGSAPLWLRGFLGGLRDFLTLETGAVGMCFLLAIIAAQISGNVLRRPNVTIYFAAAAACLYSITSQRPAPEPGAKAKKKKLMKNRS